MAWRVARRAVSRFVACASAFACYTSEPSREPDVFGDDSSVSDPGEDGGGNDADEAGDADCRVGCSTDGVYRPVCGVDGQTYANEEVARNCCHVEIAHMGVCEDDDAGDADVEADGDADSGLDVDQPDGGDVDGDADVESDGDGGIGGACPTEPNPEIPEMRMATLHFTLPRAMTGALMMNLVNDLMQPEIETFIWLLRFVGLYATGPMALTTGSGTKLSTPGDLGCEFRFIGDPYPTRDLELVESGLGFSTAGASTSRIDVGIWNEGETHPTRPLFVLPLRELAVEGTFAADHLSIGTWNSGTASWTDGGQLTGKIAVADAMDLPIEDLGITLCGLLSGDTGIPGDLTDDCTSPHPWTNEPDTTAGADPAYSVAATFAAMAVAIEDP